MASLSLKRAVDWKLFELQSICISDEADEETICSCIKWFQPRHLDEVVEERTHNGQCGFLQCVNSIAKTKQSYRIDYYSKKIYEVDSSSKFCSQKCLEQNILA